MTAACLLVRSPACSARQLQTSIVQVVHLCPTGFRKEPCERLERHKPKGLRVVLRGLGSSNAPRLPGGVAATSPPYPTVDPRCSREPSVVLGLTLNRVAFAVRDELPNAPEEWRDRAISGSAKPRLDHLLPRGRGPVRLPLSKWEDQDESHFTGRELLTPNGAEGEVLEPQYLL